MYKQVASYYEKENGHRIIVLESNYKVLFIDNCLDSVINTINDTDNVLYYTLSFINDTIFNANYMLQVDKTLKTTFIEYIEDEELENEFSVIYNILKNTK